MSYKQSHKSRPRDRSLVTEEDELLIKDFFGCLLTLIAMAIPFVVIYLVMW